MRHEAHYSNVAGATALGGPAKAQARREMKVCVARWTMPSGHKYESAADEPLMRRNVFYIFLASSQDEFTQPPQTFALFVVV